MPLEGFKLPGPRDILAGPGDEEEKKPPVKPPPPPPVEPPEYFEGYQRMSSGFAELSTKSWERLEAAKQNLKEYERAPFIAYTATLGLASVGRWRRNYEAQLQVAKDELDYATRDFKRYSWRHDVITALPYMMRDPNTPMDSVEDVYKEFPNEFLIDVDRNWLQSVFDRLEYMKPRQLPEGFTGSASEVRSKALDAILTEPPEGLRAVHNLTVEQLQKSFQPISAELPAGMTAEDLRNIMTNLEFDEQTQEEIDSIHNVVVELRKDWIEKSAYVTLVRDGILDAEAPDLTAWEFTKLLFTQPAMATMDELDKYFNMLPRPLAAHAIMAFPRLKPDSAAARLEDLYQDYKKEGMSSWQAASEAYQNWDTNVWLKMGIETVFDPTTYIGLGIATKITKPIPYVGRFVGAVERGWVEMWDLPFKYARNIITRIPKTPTQAAISYAREAFMDTRAYFRRFIGNDMKGWTVPQMRDAVENAVQQAAERPWETGDLSVRVGRYFTDYDFINTELTTDWIRVVGGEGANVTAQMTHDINRYFDMFHRKTLGSRESATSMLASMGVEATEKNIGKLSNTIDRYSKKVIDDALGIIKGDNANDVLSGLLQHVEDMQVRKAFSAEYKFAQQVGRSTSWVSAIGRGIDAVTRNGILAKIDRMVTAPMANQYLLFTNYGPFNVLESVMRSFLGGGELLYPRGASPVDELIRAGEGLTSMPYEFIAAQRDLGRLEIAVIDPKTNKTQVFNKGKIPGITKDLPVGFKINIGGQDYPIRSWQNWNDMFGDIGTKQRANYLLTKYKQYLTELGGPQIEAISNAFDKNQHILDSITSISKGDKQGVRRSMEMDATVDPSMVLKHDIPLSQLERRKALRTVNKTLDKATDVYSIHKQAIRDGILDGSVWKDVDGFMDGIKESVREFNIISLQEEARALDNLVTSFKDFAPQNSDELMRELVFISDMVDGISERVSDVRQITRARAGKLTAKETDDFYRASSTLLGDFLGKSGDDIGQILDNLKANLSAPPVERLMPNSFRDIKDFLQGIPGGADAFKDVTDFTELYSRLAIEGKDFPDELVDKLFNYVAPLKGHLGSAQEFSDHYGVLAGALEREPEELAYVERMVASLKTAIDDAEQSGTRLDKVVAIDNFTQMSHDNGLVMPHVLARPSDIVDIVDVGQDVADKLLTIFDDLQQGHISMQTVEGTSLRLTEQQLQQVDTLTEAIRIRHANAVATRDLDRKIINEAIDATPKKKRTKEWWNWLESKRGQEAWEPYWKLEEELFGQVEDAKLGMMNSLGVDVSIPPVPTISDKLAPAHVAYLMGATGDDMYKALTKMGAMTTIRPKNRFITWVYRRANKAGQKFGKTAEEIGFDKEAIGDVYDQLFRNVGIDPNFAAKEPMTPTMLQLEDVRQELIRAEGTKKITEQDYVKYQQYIRNVASDLGKEPMYREFAEVPDFEMRPQVIAKRHSISDIRQIASGTGTVKIYHGSPAEMAESFVRQGPRVPYKLQDVVDEVARTYGLDRRELSARVYRRGEQVERVSAATAPIASRWSQTFPLGERLTEVNDTARLMVRAKETRKSGETLSAAYDRVLNEGGDATKSAELPASEGNMATVLGLPDKYQLASKTGSLIELEVPVSALPKSAIHDADVFVREIASGEISEKEAIELWNHSYREFAVNPNDIKSAKIVVRNIPSGTQVGGKEAWTDIREQAMMKAREQYEMDFTDYSNRNMVDAAMRMIYPFWTYEWQRWFWLPRAMVKTPGVATGLGRYQEYSDSGYIPIPGTDIQFNPLRGTVFMGGFRRLMLRDYPEYYDAFPGMEVIDFISRVGFYPGVHIMLPVIITGAAQGKPEWGELLPGWAKTGLDAARTVAPEEAGKVIDHVFPDRFRDYLTMLTLGEWGYDADEIWRKRKQGQKLTPEEEKLWLKAEASATGLKGILFEQTGTFRLRPPEYTQYMEDTKKLIEAMTGVPADVQDDIQRRYPVTGKRLQDYYALDALQQKIIYEREEYKRWQGITTPLYPSTWQEEDIRVREFYERVEQLYDDYRFNGVFDEQGEQMSLSIDELTRQFISGQIGPDQWTSARGDLLTQASAAAREMGMRDYPDVPKTLDEREERYKERGLPAPTYSPDQEMMYMYFDLKPEFAYNWESDRMEYDYDTYFAKIDAILDTLQGEYKQRLLDRIQYNWNGMEKLYWSISREYLRPYRLVKGLVLEQYTDEQIQALRRYEVARGAEREELKDLPGPEGQKLISGFQSKIREARQKLRYLDPELDAWLYFFGITDSFITKAGEEQWNEIRKEYMKPALAE